MQCNHAAKMLDYESICGCKIMYAVWRRAVYVSNVKPCRQIQDSQMLIYYWQNTNSLIRIAYYEIDVLSSNNNTKSLSIPLYSLWNIEYLVWLNLWDKCFLVEDLVLSIWNEGKGMIIIVVINLRCCFWNVYSVEWILLCLIFPLF